jgi:dienelactone hydrolase
MTRRACAIFLLAAVSVRADDATDALAKELRDYATAELAKVPGKDGKYSTALADSLREQIAAANRRDRDAWAAVKTKADWEQFRGERIKALRDSLGSFPEVPRFMRIEVTKTIRADDYAIENLLFESRPGVWVTGNLYRPIAKRERMPVILIVHSHHAPKEQGELQDIGVTWARLGCLVLVIDQLGHGERRQHPFTDMNAYPKDFRVGRQDYYFRYNLNLQLSLVGDSLMGWMAWDLMRGLDVALSQPGADKDRVILLGAVAGGGDVAAVTAALDPRFKCVVPFNFGGPQPETRYPLPDNAEEWFNYAGSGSWESTRNLRDSAAKGFLPWVIVASVAPRRVIHAHEFSWDRDRDPVWKRYQKVWGFYDAADNLSFTHGTGVIQGNDPTASHCTNIGPIHRKAIYAALKKWFDIPIPEKESKERRSVEELRCWTLAAERELKPRPLHEVLAAMADEQTRGTRRYMASIPDADKREALRGPLAWPLGIANHPGVAVGPTSATLPRLLGCRAERIATFVNAPPRGLLLLPKAKQNGCKYPLVLCVCQDGPERFLKERAKAIATLLQAGVGVLIAELRATGTDRPGEGRGRTSEAAAIAATGLMVQRPLMGTRWSDVRVLFNMLGKDHEQEVDTDTMLLWGESLSAPNEPDTTIGVPHDLPQPRVAEPMGATVASLFGLEWEGVRAVVARGGLVSFRSVLDSPFVHVPHDALPVNVFRAGDLPDIWALLAPKPLRLEGLVDGANRRVTGDRLEKALRQVAEAYKKGRLVVKEDYTPDAELAKWIVEQLKR